MADCRHSVNTNANGNFSFSYQNVNMVSGQNGHELVLSSSLYFFLFFSRFPTIFYVCEKSYFKHTHTLLTYTSTKGQPFHLSWLIHFSGSLCCARTWFWKVLLSLTRVPLCSLFLLSQDGWCIGSTTCIITPWPSTVSNSDSRGKGKAFCNYVDKDVSESLMDLPNQGCSDSAPKTGIKQVRGLQIVMLIVTYLGFEQLLYSVFTQHFPKSWHGQPWGGGF